MVQEIVEEKRIQDIKIEVQEKRGDQRRRGGNGWRVEEKRISEGEA